MNMNCGGCVERQAAGNMQVRWFVTQQFGAEKTADAFPSQRLGVGGRNGKLGRQFLR
jgi:hypothetical protein